MPRTWPDGAGDDPLRSQLARRVAEALRREDVNETRTDDEPAGLLAWGQRYLPTHFRRPPSQMHRWLGGQLDAWGPRRGLRLNVLGPRGGAKSTIGALTYVLMSAVERSETYVWIISATRTQAATHLDNVKAELESNSLLAARYPDAVGRGPRWRATALELPNGVVIESYGTGQNLRGRRRREHRPSLVICDDLQNDLHIESPTLRDASREWFHGTLLKAGDQRTNVVNLATALHRDALAMQLHRAPGWRSALFRSIEHWPDDMQLWHEWEQIYCDLDRPDAATAARQFFLDRREAMSAGAVLLWPEEEDLYALMRMRVDEGRTAFEREKQNSPIDPQRCEWPQEYFGDHLWFREWPEDLAVRVAALDPSKGRDARFGDYSAFVLLGVDSRGTMFVEADLARRPTPQIAADALTLCRRFAPTALGVESNQFQELLAHELAAEFRRQRLSSVALYAVHNSCSKRVRLRRLGPYLSQRRLRFHSGTASTRLLVEQLRDFPIGSHDDGPDALEMALRMAEAVQADDDDDDGLGRRLIRDEA